MRWSRVSAYMNREAQQAKVDRSGSEEAQGTAASKQTLAQRGAEAPGWQQLLSATGVARRCEGGVSAARQQQQPAGTQLMIQRQERDEATATPESVDVDALRATLVGLQGEADELVLSLDLHRATGISEFADDGSVYQESLRELARRVEAVTQDVQASGDESLQTLLTEVQDALVQGYQRLAITHADKTLQAWSNSTDEDQQLAQRQRWGAESGDSTGDWCGIFVNAQYRASGLHPAFAAAFNHTSNVMQFCTYADGRRTPTEIIPAGATDQMDLRTYHEQRGSLRSWKAGTEIQNDIRPGDILIVDWGSDADDDANHTCIVSSYTPASGDRGATVVTIDGNAFGVRKPGPAMPAFDGKDMTSLETAAGTAGNNHRDLSITQWQAAAPEKGAAPASPAYQRVGSTEGETVLTIVGRGRPSVVDFEPAHQYPEAIDILEPEGALADPIQRSERGAATAKSPSSAFAAAASGGFGQIPYREEMESRFGEDFSSVQSFVGRGLDDLGALAATRGEQVVFSEASPDRQTVAHELTHVLQSRQGLTAGGKELSDPGDASEHEARSVAASLEAPATEKAAVAAAPSGAIHRQEHPTAPHPSHLDAGQDQARPIPWDSAGHNDLTVPATPANLGPQTPAREVYNYHLLHNLGLELPGELAAYTAADAGPEIPSETLPSAEGRELREAAVSAILAFLDARMAQLLGENAGGTGRTAAEAIRVPLFRASQQAVVATLNVEQSRRYQPIRDKAGNATSTFCNVFAVDVVTAMGAYLPRVWWRDPQAAIDNPALDADTVNTMQLNANALYQWMLDWGGAFGWRSVASPQAAQEEANLGKIAIILAGMGNPGKEDPGHVSVVLAESAALGIAGRGDGLPVQAQAGAANYSNSTPVTDEQDLAADTATSAWWETFPQADLGPRADGLPRGADMSVWEQYASGYGFFVYEGGGRGEVSIRTPEETGLVLPEAAVEPTEAASGS